MTEEIDHEETDGYEYTETVICPWCGHEYTKDDSWSFTNMAETEHAYRVTCESCGKPFRAQVEAWYTTFKVEQKEASE